MGLPATVRHEQWLCKCVTWSYGKSVRIRIPAPSKHAALPCHTQLSHLYDRTTHPSVSLTLSLTAVLAIGPRTSLIYLLCRSRSEPKFSTSRITPQTHNPISSACMAGTDGSATRNGSWSPSPPQKHLLFGPTPHSVLVLCLCERAFDVRRDDVYALTHASQPPASMYPRMADGL